MVHLWSDQRKETGKYKDLRSMLVSSKIYSKDVLVHLKASSYYFLPISDRLEQGIYIKKTGTRWSLPQSLFIIPLSQLPGYH